VKRYRHYTKETAILLSCFGSVIEQNMYEDLARETQERFDGCDVFVSYSSRMVIKKLAKEGKYYKNLAQTLADIDALGYKRIVVASVNLFPTDEHELLIKTVEGFKHFSMANIRHTKAIIHKTKESSLMLKALHEAVSEEGWANLYVIHGVPLLHWEGNHAVTYAESFLKLLSAHNYTCSLEGSFPFYAVGDVLAEQMKEQGITRVQIVPMLLVSGNHYRNDMVEIAQTLAQHFETRIAPSLSASERFNLIELPDVRAIIFKNIEEEIIKLGC